ncbi:MULTISPECIES: DUF6167 family protein [unclassified Arthrobacter]|uniref:DUF6167 family protein n=1 Tax=unclassified Arthrobacter TaxID=235627 RepID=UPI0002D9F988|nr:MULTISPECIES: DUF6167 family protein [unclassified Arthrobacter]
MKNTMIMRVIWMGAGVAIGVIAVRKLASVADSYGPAGLNRAMGEVTDGVANFADALRTGMQERESDLRAALGIDPAEVRPERPGQ